MAKVIDFGLAGFAKVGEGESLNEVVTWLQEEVGGLEHLLSLQPKNLKKKIPRIAIFMLSL